MMLIDVDFYLGEQVIARGRWAYVPLPGMSVRLELPRGAELFDVVGAEGVGVERAAGRSRTVGPVPVLHCQAVRVMVEPRAVVPDSPSEWTGR